MKILAVLVLGVLLAGCGFRPLYAVSDTPGGVSVQTHLQSVFVEPVPERIGYQLRNTLIDRIDGKSEAVGARYLLKIALTTKSEAIGVQSQTIGGITQTAITRYNDTLRAEFELIDAKTGAVLTKGIETGLSAYNVLASPYATLAVQQDADRRAADDIADRIRIDLAVWFAQSNRK